jgi:hypothetical protein
LFSIYPFFIFHFLFFFWSSSFLGFCYPGWPCSFHRHGLSSYLSRSPDFLPHVLLLHRLRRLRHV